MAILNTFVRLLIFTIVVVLIIFSFEAAGYEAYLYKYVWYLLAFFFGLSCITSFLTEYGVRSNPKNFQIFYFGGMFFRVFLSMIVALIIIYSGAGNILNFVTNFFALYLFFLGFEIYSLLVNLRANSKKST
jgi:hypothetical protein